MRLFSRVSYVPVLTLAMLVMMLRPLLMARVFDASGFGVYSLGLLISSSFCILGCIGLYPMLQRSMPMDIVKGREKAAAILMIQCGLLALLCLLLGLLIPFAGIRVVDLSDRGFAVSLLHGFSQQLFLVATVESRSRGEPLRFAIQNLLRALVIFGAGGLVAIQYQSVTLTLLAEAVIALVMAAGIIHHAVSRSRLQIAILCRLAIKRLGRLPWKSAIALLGGALVGFVLTNADRWIAASLFPHAMFAVYAFAWIILAVSQSIQAIISSSLFPAMARDYASNGVRSSFRMASMWGLGLILIGLVGLWPATVVTIWAIREWFAGYVSANPIIPLFYLLAIIRVSDFWTGFLIVAGRERAVMNINIFVAIAGLLLLVGYSMHQTGASVGLLELAGFACLLSFLRQIIIVIYSFGAAR